MTVSPRPPTRHLSAPSVDFLTLVPTIERHVGYAFRRVPTHLRQDLLQEALVMAFVDYRRLVDQKRHDRSFATPLARFAVFHIRDGRRVGSRRNRLDVSCPFVARRRGFRVERIDRFDPRARRWTSMTIPSSASPIPDQVAFRLDFRQWLSTQSRRNQQLIQSLACGDTTSEAARRFHISAARVSQLRLQFSQSWLAFHEDQRDVAASAVA